MIQERLGDPFKGKANKAEMEPRMNGMEADLAVTDRKLDEVIVGLVGLVRRASRIQFVS